MFSNEHMSFMENLSPSLSDGVLAKYGETNKDDIQYIRASEKTNLVVKVKVNHAFTEYKACKFF